MNDFISGAISGIFQTAIGYPFDTYKVLLQNNQLILKDIPKINPFIGMRYPLQSSVINCSLTFGINNALKSNTNLDTSITGFISGVLITPVIFYYDYYKINTQLRFSLNPTFKVIISRQGFLATLLRESIAFSIYFKSYEYLHNDCKINSYISGGISGLLNWTATYPIDIVKTRQLINNTRMIESFMEGNLWKGYTPCAIRAIIVNSTGFYIYEKCNEILN